jgi:hypothetical protein
MALADGVHAPAFEMMSRQKGKEKTEIASARRFFLSFRRPEEPSETVCE